MLTGYLSGGIGTEAHWRLVDEIFDAIGTPQNAAPSDPPGHTGWRVVNDSTTIEELGWTEVLDPGESPMVGMPRKFVKINGGEYDWLWQPADVRIVALAYRIGYSDGALGVLHVRPRYEFERDRA